MISSSLATGAGVTSGRSQVLGGGNGGGFFGGGGGFLTRRSPNVNECEWGVSFSCCCGSGCCGWNCCGCFSLLALVSSSRIVVNEMGVDLHPQLNTGVDDGDTFSLLLLTLFRLLLPLAFFFCFLFESFCKKTSKGMLLDGFCSLGTGLGACGGVVYAAGGSTFTCSF